LIDRLALQGSSNCGVRRLRNHLPRHGARFDIRTGKPLCMPATEPVRTFEIEVRWNAVLARPRD
jgi:hypothetical protein